MEWKRITDPILIPAELIEQIRGRDFDVKDFYMTLSRSTGYAHKSWNEDCYLYVLIDNPGEIVGFFWAEYDCLTRCLFSHYTSVLKRYWNKSVAIPMLKEKLTEIMKNRKIRTCKLMTDRAKAMEKLGFSKPKATLHEYQLAEVGK